MDRYRQPAEWEPHDACWLAWPAAADLWLDNLAPAREAFIALCKAIGPGERLEILAPEDVPGLPNARFHRIPYGDIWLRDIAPIFVEGPRGITAAQFAFNGWGGKYVLPHDDRASERVAAASGLPTLRHGWVLEGGSVEPNGEGVILTTEQCLLNQNRNPGMTRSDVEAELRKSLGAETVVWLKEGLLNDHTDGHIDTLARFVSPRRVVCMKPSGADDPNRRVLEEIRRGLRAFDVVEVPSPGRVLDPDGKVMPASYVNFYIANQAVAVPTYGTPYDDAAVEAIAALFPGRRAVGIPAKAILSGGGAFHCISQQQPSGARSPA